MKVLAVILLLSLGANGYFFSVSSKKDSKIKDQEFLISEYKSEIEKLKFSISKISGELLQIRQKAKGLAKKVSVLKSPKISNLKNAGKLSPQEIAKSAAESPIVDVEQTGEEPDFSEEAKDAQEIKEQYDNQTQQFFETALNLPNGSYKEYQSMISDYEKETSRVYEEVQKRNAEQFGSSNNDGAEIPFVLSYKDEQRLNDIRERAIDRLRRKIGNEKVDRLIQYEREMKIKQIMETGYYQANGLF